MKTTTECCAPELAGDRVAAESSLRGFFGNLFDTSSYPPRWQCGSWSDLEGWLHIASDIGIFTAYFGIPAALLFFIWRRRDIGFPSILSLFAAFIVFCGLTHLMEAVIFYYPLYRVAGLLKLATAIVSWITLIVLIRVIPHLLDLPRIAGLNEKLQRADEAKSSFLANMSHEVRTPMTAILGFADVLCESDDERERQRAAETIKRNARHLMAILDDVLDISKIESGRFRLEKVNCSPSRLIDEIYQLQKNRADAKGLALRQRLGALPATLHTDPVRLRQIILNLVGNAIKFTEIGHVEITADFQVADDGQGVLTLQVLDTGIGISAEEQATIFHAFSQASGGINRKYGGTGLGLTISKRLAKILGGRLALESEQGKGSQFTITLPFAPDEFSFDTAVALNENADPPELAKYQLPEEEELDEAVPAELQILLAEDGPDNQVLISHLLRKAGAEVVVVGDGQQAVEAALSRWQADPPRPFDLILMDIMMPVMDGHQATRRLRADGYTGAIYALTAHAMQHEQEACLTSGCDRVMTKPIQREELLRAVRTVRKQVGKPLAESSS